VPSTSDARSEVARPSARRCSINPGDERYHVIPDGAALGVNRAGSANGQVTCTAKPVG
jgi:hypothetical protein